MIICSHIKFVYHPSIRLQSYKKLQSFKKLQIRLQSYKKLQSFKNYNLSEHYDKSWRKAVTNISLFIAPNH